MHKSSSFFRKQNFIWDDKLLLACATDLTEPCPLLTNSLNGKDTFNKQVLKNILLLEI